MVAELARELQRRQSRAIALQALGHLPDARHELLVALESLLEPEVWQVDEEVVH